MRELRVALIVLAAAVAVTGSDTGRADESDSSRPPGVSASNWLPLGDSYGFAISRTLKPAAIQLRTGEAVGELFGYFVVGELSGYFVVKTPDGWYKLTELNEPKILPAKAK